MLTGGVSCELYGSLQWHVLQPEKIQKKRTPSREALEIRDYCRTHTFSVEEKADGEIVDHVHEVNRKC